MANARIYSIGEAVQSLRKTHPDVSHSSLRFLERIGFVHPRRTRGGHRQFGEPELNRVRQIKNWQAQGLTLEQIGQRLERLVAMPALPSLTGSFVDFAVAGEVHQAAAVVLQADDLGMPAWDIFGEIMAPAMVEIGDRWEAGELLVGQEHEVSELCRDLISEITMRHMQQPRQQFSVLAACVEGELHDLGLRMVSGLLRQAGVPVHFLGANVPASILVEAVSMRQPDLILLSAMLQERRPAVSQAIDALRSHHDDARRDAAIVVGGQAYVNDGPTSDGVIHIPTTLSLTESVGRIMSLPSAA